MKFHRPSRPLLISFSSPSRHYHRHPYHTMIEKEQKPDDINKRPRGNFQIQRKDKKPPLTHFLCLPLVNSISLPQLESSLATFKAAIPVSPSPSAQQNGNRTNEGAFLNRQRPLIPDGALRPLGTLHLTLGVMSLPTKERFDEALAFFESLDLASIMRDAESKAREREGRPEKATVMVEEQSLARSELGNEFKNAAAVVARPQPFNISLESLHALPKARSATVLHAAPVDPTSRLYPFCEILRDKFLEAGFLLGEYKNPPQAQNQGKEGRQEEHTEGTSKQGEGSKAEDHKVDNAATIESQQPAAATDTIESINDDRSLLGEIPTDIAEEPSTHHPRSHIRPIHIPQKSKLKLRPLLLHATLVNTIYVKGRQRNGSRGGNNKKSNTRLTFDARDLLDHYRDYYPDSLRTTPRTKVLAAARSQDRDTTMPPADVNADINVNEAGTSQQDRDAAGKADSDADFNDPEKNKRPSGDGGNDKNPFVWARNFPLESVCICEMGAKKLDPNEGDLSTRLGEKYRVVAKRDLNWDNLPAIGETEPAAVSDEGNSDGSLDGG